MPRVSILLQTYNQAQYLDESVASLLSQTWQDFELRIVDDCSPDDTWQVLQKYQGLPRVTLVRNPHNLGQHASTNLHMASLSGELVLFASGDDVYYPRLLERQVDAFESDPAIVLVHVNGHMIDSESKFFKLISNWYKEELESDDYLRQIADILRQDHVLSGPLFRKYLILTSNNLIASHSTCLVRRAALDAAGPFDETLPQVSDWDMWLRIAEHGDVAYLAEPLVGWRRHTESLSAVMQVSGEGTADAIRLLSKWAHSQRMEQLDHYEARRYAHRCLSWGLIGFQMGLVFEARTLTERAYEALLITCEDLGSSAVSLFTEAVVYAIRGRFDLPQQNVFALQFLDALYAEVLAYLPFELKKTWLVSFFWVVDAFEAWQDHERLRTRASAMRAFMTRPRWLRNRGLVSIMVRSFRPAARVSA